ncbi:MAG: hypothetical protein KC609_01665 [Myxococcales bacterium]|nr:hypothetical protein [Myxococcales bacterium]
MCAIQIIDKPYPHEALFRDLSAVDRIPVYDFGYSLGPTNRYRYYLFKLGLGLEDDPEMFPALDRFMDDTHADWLAFYPTAHELTTRLKTGQGTLSERVSAILPPFHRMVSRFFPELATPVWVTIKRGKREEVQPNPPHTFTAYSVVDTLLPLFDAQDTVHQFLKIQRLYSPLYNPVEHMQIDCPPDENDELRLTHKGIEHRLKVADLLRHFSVMVAFCQTTYLFLLRQYCISSLNNRSNRLFAEYESVRMAIGGETRSIDYYNPKEIKDRRIITHRLPHLRPRPDELPPGEK